jgi:hypothetical protein
LFSLCASVRHQTVMAFVEPAQLWHKAPKPRSP